MKRISVIFGIGVLLVFAIGPISVFAQSTDASEQEKIKELQAIVVQLLKLVAELQQKLLIVKQVQVPVMPSLPACGQAEITWGSVSGAGDYVLYRNGFEVYSGKDLRFRDKGLVPGATHAYTVRARNAGGLGPASPVQTITISPQCPPAIPVVWVQEGTCGGNIQVSWSRVQGGSMYELFRGNTRVFSGNVFFFVDRGLTAGNNYTYKVRAGNFGGWGEFSEEASGKASLVCPPAAPKAPEVTTPFLEGVAQEGIFEVAIHASPSGATAQSGGGGVDIVAFRASSRVSSMVIDRIDVEFSDRPWLFLSSVELREDSRVVSKVEISQDSFVNTGNASFLLRFSNFAIVIPKDGGKTISLRVVAKEDLLLVSPKELTVSIPTNGVRVRDEAGVIHGGPNLQKAPEFKKTFFVKRP